MVIGSEHKFSICGKALKNATTYFMNNFTERTWMAVPMETERKKLMTTYVEYPPRKMQGLGYHPITLTEYLTPSRFRKSAKGAEPEAHDLTTELLLSADCRHCLTPIANSRWAPNGSLSTPMPKDMDSVREAISIFVAHGRS